MLSPEERAAVWLEQHDPNRSGEAIIETLAAVIRAAVAEEREAAAKLVEHLLSNYGGAAAAIRARSKEPLP